MPVHADSAVGLPAQDNTTQERCEAPVASVPLPNGLCFHTTARSMRAATKYLRAEIFKRRRYFHPGFEIRPRDTVIDIGANMGMFVLWAAPQASQGRVLAIEPTSVISCLETNVRLNKLSNVTPIRAAVGADGGTMELITYPDFNIVTHQRGWRPAASTRFLINFAVRRRRLKPVCESAPRLSLGRVFEEHHVERVDFLKIDCEGGEYEIFRNMDASDWRRIDRIAMEFHELERGQDHRELVATLEAHGFTVQVRKPFIDYRIMRFGEIWAKRG